MLELRKWWGSAEFSKDDWLIVGKGPTFARRSAFDLAQYNTFALNHVVREIRTDVAHIIDVDVVRDCGDALYDNCRWLMMPRQPHVEFSPTEKRLEHFFDELPVLQKLSEENRLVWYNFRTGNPVGSSPTINGRYFSTGPAVDILGRFGVKRIWTLGIDGGRQKSEEFLNEKNRYLLLNSQDTYSLQFKDFEELGTKHGIDITPLVEPLRIFCGADESQRIPARVLEHSIVENTQAPVCFEPLHRLDVPIPRKPENRARTGFSFYRFAIPKLCGFRGRALYLDSDMLVFDDVEKLWDIPFKDSTILCTNQQIAPERWKEPNSHFKLGRQLSVMMLDCGKLDWDVADIVQGLDDDRYDYTQLMFDLCIVEPDQISEALPPEWNCLEWHEPSKTKLLHYTVVPTQPWISEDNPIGHLWEAEFRKAHAAGAVTDAEISQAVARGYLRPSLAEAVGLSAAQTNAAHSGYQSWGLGSDRRGKKTFAQRMMNSVRKRLRVG